MTIEELNKKIKANPEFQRLAEDDPTEFDSQVEDLYHQFGYLPSGEPMPAAQYGIMKAARATGISEGALRTAAAMPIPMVTTAAGAALGTPGGPAGQMMGAMAGSGFGEAVNEALGIIPPQTTTEKAFAVGAPLIGPGLARTGKAILPHLPGAQVAVHEMAKESLDKSLKTLRVTSDMVGDALKVFTQNTPKAQVSLPKFKALLMDETKEVGRASEIKILDPHRKQMGEFLKTMASGKVSTEKLFAWEHFANVIKKTSGFPVWKKMSGVLIEDLEDAMKNPKLTEATKQKIGTALENFRSFVKINKQHHADEALDGMLNKSVKAAAGDPDLIQFDKRAAFEYLKKNKTLTDAYSPEELNRVKEAIEDIGYIATKPTRMDFTKYGAALGATTLGAKALGLSVSTTIPVAISAAAGMHMFLKSETGRKIIRYLAKEGQGRVNLPVAQALYGKYLAAGAMTGAYGAQTPADLSAFESPRAFPLEE